MKNAFFLAALLFIGTLAGCFGKDEDADYSNFEGCTTEEEVCEEELPEPDPGPEPEPEPPAMDNIYATPQGVNLSLALYIPDSDGPHPVIMWIHGGGWRAGDRLVASNHATQQIVAQGNWAVVSVEYRLSSEAIWPAQLDDLLTALTWIRENASTYNLDAETIVAWGSSAGGHLASMLAVTPEANITAAINWYGPTDLGVLAALGNSTGTDYSAVTDLLNCDPNENGSDCGNLTRSASPALLTNNLTKPLLLMHGTDDESVPFNQSSILANALITPNRHISVIDGVHGGYPWQEELIVNVVNEFLDEVTENNVTNMSGTVDAGPEMGTWERQQVPNVVAYAHPANGSWVQWNLWDSLNPEWNDTTQEKWVLIQFAATDCGHCWNGGQYMSDLHAQYQNNLTFFTFIINFSWSDSNRDEIAAFQEELDYVGCNGNSNCMDRPGDPHNWTYVDDRNPYWFSNFHMTGTPSYVIIAPDGVVEWHSKQNTHSVSEALTDLFPEA